MSRFSDMRVAAARATDRASASALLQRLQRQGRTGHPAVDILALIAADGETDAEALRIAATAFEAGVRVHWGDCLAEDVLWGAPLPLPDALTREHPAEPWEPEEKRRFPHRVMNWRAAMAEAGRAFAEDRFAVPERVPGQALVEALCAVQGDRGSVARALLGAQDRDETFDPVAAGGHFLALAIPDFVDLDMALRAQRERAIARAAASSGGGPV